MKILFVLFLCLALLTGCWDLNLLKELTLTNGVAYDLTQSGHYLVTMEIRALKPSPTGSEPINEIYHNKSKTIQKGTVNISNQVAGKLKTGKVRIYLLGEDLARKNIFHPFYYVFRDYDSAINSNIAIVNGDANKVLDLKKVGSKLISDHIEQLIKSGEEETLVPKLNIRKMISYIFTSGTDFVIPFLFLSKEGNLELKGVSLIHDQHYTGYNLLEQKASLFMLLSNQFGKYAYFSESIKQHEKKYSVSFRVKDSKSKIVIQPTKNGLKAKVNTTLKVTLTEIPSSVIEGNQQKRDISQQLSQNLTEDAQEVVTILQDANSDALGIGYKIKAHYPEIWKNLNWEKDFNTIKIIPNVKVEVIETGIAN